MNCDLKDFAKPVRYSWLTALTGKYVNDWMTLSASVLSTVIYEDVAKGNSAGGHRKLSPYASVSLSHLLQRSFVSVSFIKIFSACRVLMICITDRPVIFV